MSEDIYTHVGWTGQPEESDFVAKWGTIYKDQILDCRSMKTVKEAANKAREMGFSYALVPCTHDNRLYKITESTCNCVYKTLDHMCKSAKRNRDRYRNDLDHRVHKMAVNARKRRAQNFDLNEKEIIDRILAGRCEVTGIRFENLADSPFRPSIDRKNPNGDYTMENIQIVCMIYNTMKLNYSEADIQKFISMLK